MEQNELKEKITEKLVAVLLVTLFTIILWGGVQIVYSFMKEKTDPEVEKYVKVLPSSYDPNVIKELKQRRDTGPVTEVIDETPTTEE